MESGKSFGLESTLSGTTYTKVLQQAKSIGSQIEIHYLSLPSPEFAIRRIAQRVKMGGHDIPETDVRRCFTRSCKHFIQLYGPLADTWQVWDNRNKPSVTESCGQNNVCRCFVITLDCGSPAAALGHAACCTSSGIANQAACNPAPSQQAALCKATAGL